MAGGDGSIVSILMKAKELGTDISALDVCILPYGTGCDLSRVTGWGGSPHKKYYKTLKSLMTEICLNSRSDFINVWDVLVKFQKGGDTLSVDSKTHKYKAHNETFYQRYMINYCGIGDDARIGIAFEMKRTKSKCCNKCVYAIEGFKKLFCCCKRPSWVNYVKHLKTFKYEEEKRDQNSLLITNRDIEEENKQY